MAGQDPLKPKDSGKIGLPRLGPGMNKKPPTPKSGGKGSKDDKKSLMLGSDTDSKGKKDKQLQEDQDLLARMRKNFDKAISNEAENRRDGLDDDKFYAGDQWPNVIQQNRKLDQRPCLTINKFPTFVHQITNDQRENRPTINVSPVGDRSDPEVAKMYRGLIRFVERECTAETAYDEAFESTVRKGWGYFRMITEYERPDSFNQVLRVIPVWNAFTVYADDQDQSDTGEDMKWCFITEMIPKKEFEQEYPDAQALAWELQGTGDSMKNWFSPDAIRVAEYFEIKNEMRDLVYLSTGHTGWKDELSDEILDDIESGKITIERERRSPQPKVKWYKATALEVLERNDWIGSSIPVYRVIGDRINVEGKNKLFGIIRNSKDAQRMYNYWCPLSLDTPIPTPTGWTTMGDVRPGDYVLGDDGKPTLVVGESPIKIGTPCYRVTFDDGSHIDANDEHPWQVSERGKRTARNWSWSTKIVTTKELTPRKHYIPTTLPLDLPETDLPIHPYFLGAWLGDGKSTEPQMCAGDADIHEMHQRLAAFGCRVGGIRKYGDRVGVFTVHGVRKEFSRLGLLGNKHIPAMYLRASRTQRLMLLQGLMDTDGAISKNHQCSLTTVFPGLAEGFAELLRGLGIKAVSIKRAGRRQTFPGGNTYDCSDAIQFSFSPQSEDRVFLLARKAAELNRNRVFHRLRTKRHSIVSVEPIPSVPVKCIRVDNASHLFLAGESMVPTHNTAETEIVALAPKAPWVMEEGQIEGHEDEWQTANTRSIPVLQYRGVSVNGTLAPPPQRQTPSPVPSGIVNAKQGAAQDMMATTGIRFDSTLQERTYDESGRALRELQRKGDVGSFHYFDNLCRTLKRLGADMVECIPKVYDAERIVTILREDDSEERVKIDPRQSRASSEVRGKDGKTLKIFNPTFGEYGVTVTIGPSYATKRIEAVESMMQFVSALPETAKYVVDLIAKNQDWPGASEIAGRLAKVLAMQAPQLMMPDMKDVPPEAAALIQGMDAHIKQMTQQQMQMLRALNDKEADRQVDRESIQKDFEAKLLKVVADYDAKMHQSHQKIVDTMLSHGRSVDELGTKVIELSHKIEQGERSSDLAERKLEQDGQQAQQSAA